MTTNILGKKNPNPKKAAPKLAPANMARVVHPVAGPLQNGGTKMSTTTGRKMGKKRGKKTEKKLGKITGKNKL